jgi:hypothetical protein
VNPWELEVDPEIERTPEELEREREAEQRALRAAAVAMRRRARERSLATVSLPCLSAAAVPACMFVHALLLHMKVSITFYGEQAQERAQQAVPERKWNWKLDCTYV